MIRGLRNVDVSNEPDNARGYQIANCSLCKQERLRMENKKGNRSGTLSLSPDLSRSSCSAERSSPFISPATTGTNFPSSFVDRGISGGCGEFAEGGGRLG